MEEEEGTWRWRRGVLLRVVGMGIEEVIVLGEREDGGWRLVGPQAGCCMVGIGR